MRRPLGGYRVLDLTNVLAGPFCCHQLAHLGAEIIKIEVPGSGDLARQLGPDPELNAKRMGVSFLAQNAGKKSVTLNLKHPQGKGLLKALVREADVLVENFRPGVMERLGVGYEALRAENAELVYCAISGFGQDGPLRMLPAYDQIIQGLSGVMSITGERDTGPYRVGYPMADTIGGLTAAFAVASALAARTGPQQARGCFIDVSMLESVIATMGWAVSNYLIADQVPEPFGNENVTAAPSGTFCTGAGLLNIAANKQEQFASLCRVLERPELLDDPRFTEREARLAHRFELKALVEDALQSGSASEWAEKLNAAGVPAGGVLTIPDILDHPQVRDRELVARFADVPGIDKDVRLVRCGFKIDGQAPRVDAPPSSLGANTDEVLAELGLSAEEIAQLREQGVV